MRSSTPINGEMLNVMKATLGARVSDLLWLFGWGSAYWQETTKKQDGELPGRHAILIRLLTDRPDLSPIPKPPSGLEVYEMLREIDPSLRPREFAVLVGLQPNSKDRLLDDTWPKTASVEHILLIIKNELDRLTTKSEKEEFFKYYKEIVTAEALSRGMDPDNFLTLGGWQESVKRSKAKRASKAAKKKTKAEA